MLKQLIYNTNLLLINENNKVYYKIKVFFKTFNFLDIKCSQP